MSVVPWSPRLGIFAAVDAGVAAAEGLKGPAELPNSRSVDPARHLLAAFYLLFLSINDYFRSDHPGGPLSCTG